MTPPNTLGEPPPGFMQAERVAITQLLEQCFGNTLPGGARISILRHRVDDPTAPDGVIVSSVLVDGQPIGDTIGLLAFRDEEKQANAFMFAIRPKFSL